ncbi:MAG: amidohydrolase family protein [Proteobacteria bacterium]|nr:amidohydrolase family protein [Pseudomonadota bacterium]
MASIRGSCCNRSLDPALPSGRAALTDLLIRNVRPMGGDVAAIAIADGRIAAIGAPPPGPAARELDGGGRIAIPGLIEAHTHLDKNLLGMPWYRNAVGPKLTDRIDNERAERKRMPIDARRQSARQAALSVSHGTTHIRTHVDVDTETGVAGIEGVMATRAALADQVGIDIVAFPQSGLLIRPGTLELMEQALRLGAETVGGIDPCAIDRDPKGHLDAVFGLAERFGRGVDIHLHETGELGAFSMELIIERTRALGMAGRVIVSHAFCLGAPDPALVEPLIAGLAENGIAIMTTGTPSRPVPPVKRLAQAGVTVCAGSDGIRDTWGPYGNADMLERATLLGMRNNLRRDDELPLALAACTTGGAAALGLSGYGLEAGCHADLVLVEAETLGEAIAQRPGRRTTVRRGRVVAESGAACFSVE